MWLRKDKQWVDQLFQVDQLFPRYSKHSRRFVPCLKHHRRGKPRRKHHNFFLENEKGSNKLTEQINSAEKCMRSAFIISQFVKQIDSS